MSKRNTARRNSRDSAEIGHFSRDSRHWWDESGPFAPLHRINPVRLRYVRDRALAHFSREGNTLTPFKKMKILDIGCGGGLMSEPLARLGATVTGIDADGQALTAARAHAEVSRLDINYVPAAAEDLLDNAANRGTFDVVLALEIVEHVNDPAGFVQSAFDLCRPGGLVIFSTLNRTVKSMALGIVAAEYVLGWVPKGTHQWRKFLRPSELAHAVERAGGRVTDLAGMRFDPFTGQFALDPGNLEINYFLSAEKSK